MFNWSTSYIKNNNDLSESFKDFQLNWQVEDNLFKEFLTFAKKEIDDLELEKAHEDKKYLKIILKSEIAGAKWGIDQLWGVRANADNQLSDALKHFDEASSFIIN